MFIIPFSYSTQFKLKSFSEKIKCFSQKNLTYDGISEIFFEKEKHSLVFLIAHVINSLTFSNKSKEAFLSVIKDYNMENDKDLKFEEFEEIYWIRIVQDEVVLPETVSHLIWSINNNGDGKNEVDSFPERRREMALCLAAYVKTHDEPSISKEQLIHLQTTLNLTWESILFLIDKHILEYNETNRLYYWQGKVHYQEQLENEVSALLWILLKKQFCEPEKLFHRYLYLANKTGLNLSNIYPLLSKEDNLLIYQQAVDYIINNQDLIVCDDELEKIRLDSSPYYYNKINQKAPKFCLHCDTINELFGKFDQLIDRRLYDFTYQKTRMHFYLVLRLIIQSEQREEAEKNFIIKFLSDLKRPSIVFMLKFLLVNSYPHMIPFLISNIQLVPLAFNMLDDMKLNKDIIISDEDINSKHVKEYELRNELWLDLFTIVLNHFIDTYHYNENNQTDSKLRGEAISSIFINIANNIFGQYTNIVQTENVVLNAMQERYTAAFNILKKSKTNFNIYNKGLYVKSKFSFFMLPYIIRNIESRLQNLKTKYNNFIDFDIINLDVLIDMLGISITPFDSIEIGDEQKQIICNLLPESVNCIYNYLLFFFTVEKVIIEEYDFSTETKDVEIAFDIDKLDRTNWSLLVILLGKYNLYQSLMDNFNSAINLDKSKSKYDYPNKNQYHRIRVMLRILLYSYLNLKKEKVYSDLSVSQQESILVKLEISILRFANLYSKDDIPNNRIDAFYEFPELGEIKHENDVLYLFFTVLNYFPLDDQKEALTNFFIDSIDLKRMLKALNIIESEEVKKIVEECIIKINIDKFMDSCFTVTEWEETLIEAINSEKYWYFAKSLVENIKEHYEKRKINDEQINFLLYQVELSLALRNKDLKMINNIQYKKNNYENHRGVNPDDIKRYFIALYLIENEKKYDNAIVLLKSLLVNDEKNIRYILLLYKAHFLKFLLTEENDLSDLKEIENAWHEWQELKQKLGNDENKLLEIHQGEIFLYSLPYYILNKEYNNFDRAISSISNELIYSTKLFKLIYDCYIERGLENLALQYLKKSHTYFKKNDKAEPALISELFNNPDNEVLLMLRESLRDIITLHYKSIPIIIPQIINGQKEISTFILNELIKSLKQLQNRIKLIRLEDDYTDIIQSILSMRLPFYGWDISEQPHRGSSTGGKRPGEVDLVIKAGDEDIALIEALILKNNDQNKIEEHICKILSYSNRADQYYIIVYYQGEQNNFHSVWEGYKKSIQKIVFPNGGALINQDSPFINLNDKFDDIRTFRIGKTRHESNFEMFHVMVDFSHQKKLIYNEGSDQIKNLGKKDKLKGAQPVHAP